MRFTRILLAVAMIAILGGWAQGQDSKSRFEEPVFLKVGDSPMNEDGSMMYPSPAIFDVDNDGQDELVVGTIFGGVFACENENTGKGDPQWSEP